MNARICELINQAKDPEHGFVIPEKLVGLVIRECMNCATWVGQVNTHPTEPVNTAHAINRRIKTTLGVNL